LAGPAQPIARGSAGWKRREVITLLGGATAWPMAARAQQSAPKGRFPIIGWLVTGSPSTFARHLERLGTMPAGAVEKENGVCPRRDLGCNCVEMKLHGLLVANRQHHRAEQISQRS
jgi:hypothetical protein